MSRPGYRLCVDMDSGKAGDVGEIYVSPMLDHGAEIGRAKENHHQPG